MNAISEAPAFQSFRARYISSTALEIALTLEDSASRAGDNWFFSIVLQDSIPFVEMEWPNGFSVASLRSLNHLAKDAPLLPALIEHRLFLANT
jgi:hypothetical protein